jgi:hypothetical protein
MNDDALQMMDRSVCIASKPAPTDRDQYSAANSLRR